jgi:hypothetical protein
MDVSDQLHAPATLPKGKISWFPLNKKLDGPKNMSRRFGAQRGIVALPGMQRRIDLPIS